MKKILLFFFFYVNFVFAELEFKTYTENVLFTDDGKDVSVVIEAIVKLPKDYYQDEWTYIFSPEQKIQIVEGNVAEKQSKVTFDKNNNLTFKYDKAVNGDKLTFIFKYKEFNEKSKYNRDEWIQIPDWMAGVNGSFEIKIPSNYIVYSNNEIMEKSGNTYRWNGIVDKKGFSELFLMTLKQAEWKATQSVIISTNESELKNVRLTTPAFFRGGNATITNYQVKTEKEAVIKEENNEIKVDFSKYKGKKVQVDVVANLSADFSKNNWIKVNMLDATKMDKKTKQKLLPILAQIRNEYANDTSPMYVKIAKWVHNNIKYDMKYFAKNMSVEDILRERGGVCEQYAILYNALIRASNIPSIMVSGKSYDTAKDDFEDHAWNMIFYNGLWLGIDPTWGLYSGKLPITHIFFNYKFDDKYSESEVLSYNENGLDIKLERNVKEKVKNNSLVEKNVVSTAKENIDISNERYSAMSEKQKATFKNCLSAKQENKPTTKLCQQYFDYMNN